MIRVRYFGALREAMGRGEAALDLPSSVKTGRDLVNMLAAQFPHAAAQLNSPALRIALDHTITPLDATLAGAHEVALMPPMTGG
jgi:molybdopterin synthase sulfur carrier subunit